MNIVILTPRSNSPLAGNQTTAERWQDHLKALGHGARILFDEAALNDPALEPCDWLIALHAYKSAPAIRHWKARPGPRPLTLILTGTDLYQCQIDAPEICHRAMAEADTLVGLHDRVHRVVPSRFHPKLRIIRQSSPWIERQLAAQTSQRQNVRSPQGTVSDSDAEFGALVSGHLRQEKDSLRAALAVRDLPADSRIHVRQAGQAHSPEWARLATEEMAQNARYTWLGELAHEALFEELRKAQVLVMSSRMEGGANAVSEAILMGLPILASRIDGNTGLLGEDYPALFPVEDTSALRELLWRAERDAAWLESLRVWLRELRPLFTETAEREAIRQLTQTLSSPA